MPTSARFDAGYGSAYFARQVGQKFAREVFFLAREYSAQRAYEMGAINAVVPHAELEATAIRVGRTKSSPSRPTAIRMLKFAFNAVDDGMVGQQVFAGEATRLAYGTDEAVEGRDAFLQKRDARLVAVPLAVLMPGPPSPPIPARLPKCRRFGVVSQIAGCGAVDQTVHFGSGRRGRGCA